MPPTDSTGQSLKTRADLGWLGALLRSLLDLRTDFYPRLGSHEIRSVRSEEIIQEMARAMSHWERIDRGDADLDKAIELARASLNEAKQQTEYQDQKATRLLTVTTFLTALAGAFFATFSSDYPLRALSAVSSWWPWILLVATYVLFLLFVLCALAGALVTFHGTRTRFKYPGEATVEKQSGPTRSYLFYPEVVGVSPTGWAHSFVTVSDFSGQKLVGLKSDLRIQYLKNYVSESYLVAAKTADKIRYLQPAQSLLAYALRFLLAYIVLLAVVMANIEPTKPASKPYRLEFVSFPAPLQSVD